MNAHAGIHRNIVDVTLKHWKRWGLYVIPVAVVCLILHIALRCLWVGERVTVFVVGIWPLYIVFQYYILYRSRASEVHSIIVLAAVWCYYVSYHYLHVYEGFKYISTYSMDRLLPDGYQVLLEWVFISLLLIVVLKLANNIASVLAVLLLYIGEPVGIIESLRVAAKYHGIIDFNRYVNVMIYGLLYFVICAAVIAVLVYKAWVSNERTRIQIERNSGCAGHEDNKVECIYDLSPHSFNIRTYAIDAIVFIMFIIVNCVPIMMRDQLADRYNTEIVQTKSDIVDDVSRQLYKYVDGNTSVDNSIMLKKDSSNTFKDKLTVFMPKNRKYWLNTEHDLRCLRAGAFWEDTYRCIAVVLCDANTIALKAIHGGSQYYILVVYDAANEHWRPLLYCDSDQVIHGDSYMNISMDSVGFFEQQTQ